MVRRVTSTWTEKTGSDNMTWQERIGNIPDIMGPIEDPDYVMRTILHISNTRGENALNEAGRKVADAWQRAEYIKNEYLSQNIQMNWENTISGTTWKRTNRSTSWYYRPKLSSTHTEKDA